MTIEITLNHPINAYIRIRSVCTAKLVGSDQSNFILMAPELRIRNNIYMLYLNDFIFF